jgi:hypothetical protein
VEGFGEEIAPKALSAGIIEPKALGLPAWANICPLPKHGALHASYFENDSDVAALILCSMGQAILLFGTAYEIPRCPEM